MRYLTLCIFLFISSLLYSQFYERIGKSRDEIYYEFSNYKTVEKITDRCSLYICTNKAEIFYIFDEYTDICNTVYVLPLNKKIALCFLNEYKKKYTQIDGNEFEYYKKSNNIQMLYLFNSKNELFFTFKEKIDY